MRTATLVNEATNVCLLRTLPVFEQGSKSGIIDVGATLARRWRDVGATERDVAALWAPALKGRCHKGQGPLGQALVRAGAQKIIR